VGGADDRPMLRLADPFVLYEERRLLYEEAADLGVDTDGRTPEEVAAELAVRLGAPPQGVRRIRVGTGEDGYEVVVGSGLIDRLARLVPIPADAERAFVVAQPGLGAYVDAVAAKLRSAGLAVAETDVPAGEEAKTVSEAERLWTWLADLGASRHDLVVAVGGGAVTDLAGFVAATYARGLASINVPTTLLGQVDAAIGAKTGVNLPQGKNLVGSFHRPRAVICDVDTLRTLPEAELRAGLAEVAKYGFIAEPGLLDLITERIDALLARDAETVTEVVARSVAIKAAIVTADEREAGERAHLNYGHTFAHAIEHAAGFSGIRHGEAVALGMMAAAYLAHELGRIGPEVVDRHRAVLTALGLPVAAKLDVAALEGAWRRDKKYRRGVRFVLLAGLGRPEAGVQAPRAALERALARMAPDDQGAA
jgi:3-dehydroquinate synthase